MEIETAEIDVAAHVPHPTKALADSATPWEAVVVTIASPAVIGGAANLTKHQVK